MKMEDKTCGLRAVGLDGSEFTGPLEAASNLCLRKKNARSRDDKSHSAESIFILLHVLKEFNANQTKNKLI